MKAFNKAGLHILFWLAFPLLILYFKWAAQDTTSLPGLPGPESESFFEIVQNNIDLIIVSLSGAIPVFYWSFFCLTPKLLFKPGYIKIMLYILVLAAFIMIVCFVIDLVFPMYFYSGTPFAIKILAPIVLLSALGGTLFAYMNKIQVKNI